MEIRTLNVQLRELPEALQRIITENFGDDQQKLEAVLSWVEGIETMEQDVAALDSKSSTSN